MWVKTKHNWTTRRLRFKSKFSMMLGLPQCVAASSHTSTGREIFFCFSADFYACTKVCRVPGATAKFSRCHALSRLRAAEGDGWAPRAPQGREHDPRKGRRSVLVAGPPAIGVQVQCSPVPRPRQGSHHSNGRPHEQWHRKQGDRGAGDRLQGRRGQLCR